MITLELSPQQLDDLYNAATSHQGRKVRKKCMTVYLRGLGHTRENIACIVRSDLDTVTNQVKRYAKGGLQALLENNYRKPESPLKAFAGQLTDLFEKQPPHTACQAIEMIFVVTGIRFKHSACQAFLKKQGLKCRRCGVRPGKLGDDEKQQQAQQLFHDQALQPRLDEAKQGRRTVLFVDAAHFVMGAFLGMVWCLQRVFLPSASGVERYNVLGAYDPVRHQVITVTNDTYINQDVFCAFLDKIAAADTSLPITLVLDNARYQKCQSVFDKARELGIELLYLPPYSPNLNLTPRLWRFVKKQVLYSTHYDRFAAFKDSIDICLADLGTRFRANMETLMTLRFQLFSKKTEKLTV